MTYSFILVTEHYTVKLYTNFTNGITSLQSP